MAEFVVKLADERGRMHQQVEHGYSVAEVRDRFASQGYLVYWVKPQGMLWRLFAEGRPEAEAEFVSGVQPAIFNADQGGVADFEFAGPADQTAKGSQLGQILENVRERVKGGELLSDAFATHPAWCRRFIPRR